ncbi:hypothetical protein [Novimethylophilus kurashikiensis]|uniref:hypothetical protein n=1 Tax=Novimethylophilus kurashikiensis TaxID=1825523 RepID=UPI0011B213C6|nr:hypothetical protein [Novimethylophilus kurashikiensis]
MIIWPFILMASAGLGWLGWDVAHGHYYKPGDEIGYNMGLIGGLMMLTLLTYPIRKHFRFALRWGAIKYWFSLHMMFGIFGPLLVLFHSTFHINSINAGVALFSMALVAGSGVIGRYAYRHIHRGLYGSKLTLNELKNELLGSESEAESKLKNHPKVLLLLHDFQQYALETNPGFFGKLVKFMTLPIRRQIANLRCTIYMPRYSRNSRKRREMVLDYLYAVERVAQFDMFERIFSLWHVAHIPLVYLLAATAIWHVIAVHMY